MQQISRQLIPQRRASVPNPKALVSTLCRTPSQAALSDGRLESQFPPHVANSSLWAVPVLIEGCPALHLYLCMESRPCSAAGQLHVV